MEKIKVFLWIIFLIVFSNSCRTPSEKVEEPRAAAIAELASVYEITGIKPAGRSRCQHSGWAFDSEPFVDRLLAGHEMEVLQAEGPGIVKYLHITHSGLWRGNTTSAEAAEAARSVVLLIYYNGMEQPSVQVPLGDFFCDV